ncbi:MAG: hypothetical protein F8N36_01090 [Desulfovibrio sp.]|uniref:hypothetical protein n=1 Tax=Desulfovibrio sp. TaxID=885 RepID=UPI00135E4B25|nr:hypothetical protein [Desulfovibrio sp.]MTJ91453.1 hypothetical protein [Desulfovibrio sp.]
MTGNRCGHDPKHPRLSPAKPIRKGKGGLPRILSLAAERAKAWYYHPKKCKLLQSHPHRKTRSERREACQIVIETILSHLDLASLCVGTPTLENGFIDIDMRTIVRDSGMGQRRCERAIALLKEADFMKVQQPRVVNDQGDYVGLRAIRVVTTLFFEFLNLGPMLQRERARATERLQRRARKAQRKLTDFMRRGTKGLRISFGWKSRPSQADMEKHQEETHRWNIACAKYMIAGLAPDECRRRTNVELGLPTDYSPSRYE